MWLQLLISPPRVLAMVSTTSCLLVLRNFHISWSWNVHWTRRALLNKERFPLRNLDGQAIRNANRGDSRESIRTNRFAEKPLLS